MYAGVLATDVCDKLRVYKDVMLDDKRALTLGCIHEFHAVTENAWRNGIVLVDNVAPAMEYVTLVAGPSIAHTAIVI